jgi:hypothetical protein
LRPRARRPRKDHSHRKEDARIKTLPGWTIGALVVLAAFCAGAVALTRWLDGQGSRGFFSPAPAPACVENDCAQDAGVAAVETVTPAIPPAPPSAPPRPAELVAIDAAPVEPTRPGDASFRDAVAMFAASAAPIPLPALRAVSSAVGAIVVADASRAPAAAVPDASVAPARVEDAGPRGVRCGSAICPEGQVCCNASCSTCRPPGASCSQVQCGPISPMSAACGPNTCNVGEVCCNASCGICTPPGGTCSQQKCDGVQVPISVHCGPNTCNVGQVCCNASCGICTNPGETCRKEPCN